MTKRISIRYLLVMFFILVIGASTAVIRYVEHISWVDSLDLVMDALLSSGNFSATELHPLSQFTTLLLAIFGAFIELIIIFAVVNLLLKLILSRQDQIERYIQQFVESYPLRKSFGVFFVSISAFVMILFKVIERTSWLDALYYILVTMATVGFGDIIATQPITKVLTVVLIINGVMAIAVASELILDRIVKFQFTQFSIPNEPIPYSNHIVVGGYGAKGRRLAQLFQERRYDVIVVEQNEDRAKLAELNGFLVIKGDITKPVVLDILSLDQAVGLFLLLSDDNIVIQTGILARSIAPKLDIYAEFLSGPTYDIARYAGINKPISLSGFLTNQVQNYLGQSNVILSQSMRDLRQQETMLGFVTVPRDFDYEELFDLPIVIGEVEISLNEIYIQNYLALDDEQDDTEGTHLLIAVDKEELDQKLKGQRESRSIKRIVFAGYSDLVESLINRIDLTPEETVILWHTPDVGGMLQQRNYKKYKWSMENGHMLLEQVIRNDDIVICSFDDITSSLIVGVTLKKLKEEKSVNTQLIQLAPYEFDIEPLIKVGAQVVFTPQQIIPNAMITIFLKENNLTPSLVYTNGHIYEHLVTPSDFFAGKRVIDLEEDKFNVMLLRKDSAAEFRPTDIADRLKPGDRILVFIKNIKKERLDMLT